ncbi:MAG: integration host factor, actinobacterial type [Ilumatobacteraceae bacterium]
MSPSPVITSEQRCAVIEKARAVRREMTEVREHVANATLSLTEALSNTNPDSAINRLYVVKLLESLRGVGKVQARRVMCDIGITEKCRVSELGANHRMALLEEFGQ